MRAPSILDLVQAVTEIAPAHPEVAVWWYTRIAEPNAAPMLLVVQAKDGTGPDCGRIGAELATRFGAGSVAVRHHRGPVESRALYRLLTAASHPEGTI
jgi:hypothetical protein